MRALQVGIVFLVAFLVIMLLTVFIGVSSLHRDERHKRGIDGKASFFKCCFSWSPQPLR